MTWPSRSIRRKLLLLLPERQRLVLGDADIERVGQPALDRDAARSSRRLCEPLRASHRDRWRGSARPVWTPRLPSSTSRGVSLASFDDDLAQAIARIGARRQQAPGDLAVDRRRYAGAPEPAGAAGQQQGDGRDGSAAPGDALPARRGPAARGLARDRRGAGAPSCPPGALRPARGLAPRSMASGFKRRIARSPPSSRRDRERRCRDRRPAPAPARAASCRAGC